MNEYRTYVIGDDGHIKSSRAFVCENDADAIVWAKQLVEGHDIALWSRDRLVKRRRLHNGAQRNWPQRGGGGLVS